MSSGYSNNRNSTDSYLNDYSSRINGNNSRNHAIIGKSKDVIIMTSPRNS